MVRLTVKDFFFHFRLSHNRTVNYEKPIELIFQQQSITTIWCPMQSANKQSIISTIAEYTKIQRVISINTSQLFKVNYNGKDLTITRQINDNDTRQTLEKYQEKNTDPREYINSTEYYTINIYLLAKLFQFRQRITRVTTISLPSSL